MRLLEDLKLAYLNFFFNSYLAFHSLAPRWKVGDQCRAIYEADGLYYDSTILSFDATESGEKYARISYNGYDSEFNVWVKDLKTLDDPTTEPSEAQADGTASADATEAPRDEVKAAASMISGTGDAPMPEKAAIEVPDVKAAPKVPGDSEVLTLISSDVSNLSTGAGSPANGKRWKEGDS